MTRVAGKLTRQITMVHLGIVVITVLMATPVSEIIAQLWTQKDHLVGVLKNQFQAVRIGICIVRGPT